MRYYNSLAAPNTLAVSLGSKWRSTYDRYLQFTSSGGTVTSVIAERPDGQELRFTPTSGGGWATDSDIDLTLTQSGPTWTLTDNGDTVETYTQISSSAALLQGIRARGGYTQTLYYNPGYQLTSVVDSYERSLNFSYDNALLKTVTTPDGLVLTYGYTASDAKSGVLDRLASVSYSTSPATSQSYLYENAVLPFALTGITDEDGNRYATWSYDNNGRGLSSQHAGGADLTTVVYNDQDGSRTVTNALGQQEVYQFAILQGVPKVTEIDRLASAATAAAIRKFTYDANGYLASATDWNGNPTTYQNNARGEPTSISEAAGTTVARSTMIDWHSTWHEPTKIVTPGLTTTLGYDANGDLHSRTEIDTVKGARRNWTLSWSNFQVAAVQGPRTDLTQRTSFNHNNRGWLTGITNALGQTTGITGHLPGGLPTVIVDPNGVTTKLAYDQRLRLHTSTVLTAAGARTTTFDHDAAGNLTKVTLPDGSFFALGYDAAHRLISVTDALGEPITFTPDGLGDPIATIIATALGAAVAWQDSEQFDALGRLKQDVRGAGQTTKFGYDGNGNLVTKLDPLARTTTYAPDALNRLSEIIDPAKGVTRLRYDAHDRPTKVTAPNGVTTTYAYDGFGRVTQRVSPDTGTTRYYYDLADNLTQVTDGGGVITRHTYDALNRPITTSYPGNPGENVAFAYDESGHGFGIGHLTTVADTAGTLKLSYDERGNELGEARGTGALTLTTGYGYDAASRVALIAYPSGATVSYGRDAAGRVTTAQVKTPGGSTKTVAAGVTYKPFGPVSGLTYGNGIAERRSYDLDYRLDRLVAGSILARTYHYDAADNVKSIVDGVTPANSQAFGYDKLDHLKAAAGGYGNVAWTYDLVGNRLSESAGGAFESTYSYVPKTNRLASITAGGAVESFGYTGSGSISNIMPASGPEIDLAHNQAGRLSAVTSGGNSVASYGYDAFGERLSKTLPTAAALFQYDQAGRLLEELDGKGNAKTDTIYLNGVPVGSLAPKTGVLSFLHTDHLGTPQLATNAARVLVWGASYEPFGGLNGLPSGSLTQNLRFPGQYADAETGWYQNGFRDYAPLWGRYLESDPIGLAGGINTYEYGLSNPLNNVDIIGMLYNNDPITGPNWPDWANSTYRDPNVITPEQISISITPYEAYSTLSKISKIGAMAFFLAHQPRIAVPLAGFSYVMEYGAYLSNPTPISTSIKTAGGFCIEKSFESFGSAGIMAGYGASTLFENQVDIYDELLQKYPANMNKRPK